MSTGAHSHAPLVRVHLRRDAHRVAKAKQHWLTRRQISKIQGPPDPGALAQIFDARGRELGWGLYAPDAKIAVRVLSWSPQPLAVDWLERRVWAALEARKAMGFGSAEQGTTGYREVNSEGDGLPGLVVDRYDAHRVLQITTAAMDARAAQVLAALQRVDEQHARTVAPICVRPEAAAQRENFRPGVEGAAPEYLRYREHGIEFCTPAPPTQKTGAYHDQRENRREVAELAAADGRPLLDLGCHVGGFSVHAAALGVDALAVDQSARMLEWARRNADALGPDAGKVDTLGADIFAPMRAPEFDREFGSLVFDPPKIATNPRDVPRARGAMTRALRQATQRLGPAGLLVVCSCSHHIDADAIDEVVAAALERGHRALARRGPGADHPVAPGHVQGEYLRVNFYRVD